MNKQMGMTVCMLEDGSKYLYDECSSFPLSTNRNRKYIGKGSIYSVNGKRQSDTEEFYFYQYVG